MKPLYHLFHQKVHVGVEPATDEPIVFVDRAYSWPDGNILLESSEDPDAPPVRLLIHVNDLRAVLDKHQDLPPQIRNREWDE